MNRIAEIEVGDEILHDLAYPLLPGEREPVDVGSPQEHRGGAEGEGLEDIGAAASRPGAPSPCR